MRKASVQSRSERSMAETLTTDVVNMFKSFEERHSVLEKELSVTEAHVAEVRARAEKFCRAAMFWKKRAEVLAASNERLSLGFV